MRFDVRIAIARFDFRVPVALGSITLMLASVPLLTRHSAHDVATQPALPQAAVREVAVADIPSPPPAPQIAAPVKSKAAPVSKVEDTAKAKNEGPQPVSTPASPAHAPVTVTKLVHVPLPKPRPHSIAAAPVVATSAVTANVPLPTMRPQSIANPVQTVQTAPENTPVAALVHAPLPKARPQAIAKVERPQTAPIAAAPAHETADESAAFAGMPVHQPEPSEHAISADAKLANASVDFSATHPDASSVPNAGAIATTAIAEFKPPMPRIRPANIDRLVLVAEMRKYMGTNPTNRRALWCATFMNMVLNKLGYKGTQSDAARSFVDYGRKIPGPKVGAIAVLSRGPNGGHVGVVSGVDKHGNPIIVSGNHGHRVGVGTYPRGRVLAYVLPTPKEFKRAAARFSERTQRQTPSAPQRQSALTTTQLAARSTPGGAQNDDLPITELLAALAAENSEDRPGSASLRSRANRGTPVTSLLAKFLSNKN